MNKLALGTVQFGLDYGVTNASGKAPLSEVEKILKLAKVSGINTLDTASGYGNSEEVLGSIGANDFNVVTKTVSLASGVEKVLQSFQQSLRRLNTSSVDGLLVHNIDDVKNPNFDLLYKELDRLKQDGLINKIGFSTYTPEQVDFLVSNFDIDLVQLPFNILDRRMIDSGMLATLKSKGIEVHARSVFLQGLLLMSEKNRPDKFNRWHGLWKVWHEWLNDNQISALEGAVRHVISMPEISKVLVGVDNVDQLKEIVTASSGVLPDIPNEMFTNDVDLLNPSNWSVL